MDFVTIWILLLYIEYWYDFHQVCLDDVQCCISYTLVVSTRSKMNCDGPLGPRS